MDAFSIVAVAFSVAVPIAIYAASIFVERKRQAESGRRDVFLARQMLNRFEFTNSSIAFGFQIASISLFLAWGYVFGLTALINPIFWGVGIVVFVLFIGRIVKTLEPGETLHGYLARHYSSGELGKLGALMTMTGYLGALIAELSIGCLALSFVLPNKVHLAVLATGLALFIATYIWIVGQRAALETDLLQLGFSYLGFVSLAVGLLWLLFSGAPVGPSTFFLGCLLLLVVGGIVVRVWYQTGGLLAVISEGRYSKHIGRQVSALAILGVTCLAFLVIATLLLSQLGSVESAATEARSLFGSSQGFWNYLSLAALPFFWQFIDVPMWQRIQAIETKPDLGHEGQASELRTSLWKFAFESPATWTLAIIMGISLRYLSVGIDDSNVFSAFETLPQILMSGVSQFGGWSFVLATLFLLAIVGTMLSTVDSMFSSSVFVGARDIAGIKPESSEHEDEKIARLVSYSVFLVAVGIIWAQFLLGWNIVSILLGGYAAQLSLVPSVLGILIEFPRGTPSKVWAIASVLAGLLGSGFATVVALTDDTWQLYAPLFALGASFAVYAFGVAVGRSSTREAVER